MKFQTLDLKIFFERTDKQTNKQKAICSPLFQSWGHKNKVVYVFVCSEALHKPFRNKTITTRTSCRMTVINYKKTAQPRLKILV